MTGRLVSIANGEQLLAHPRPHPRWRTRTRVIRFITA
jgi:hypothetical protein